MNVAHMVFVLPLMVHLSLLAAPFADETLGGLLLQSPKNRRKRRFLEITSSFLDDHFWVGSQVYSCTGFYLDQDHPKIKLDMIRKTISFGFELRALSFSHRRSILHFHSTKRSRISAWCCIAELCDLHKLGQVQHRHICMRSNCTLRFPAKRSRVHCHETTQE